MASKKKKTEESEVELAEPKAERLGRTVSVPKTKKKGLRNENIRRGTGEDVRRRGDAGRSLFHQ